MSARNSIVETGDFRVIPGFPDYMVSSDGRVLSRKVYGSRFGGIGPWWEMKPKRTKKQPRIYVDLFREVGRPERHFVHRLMLSAFVGPCPEGMEGRHLDDNPANNNLANLAWGTRRQNVHDALRNGRFNLGENRPRSRFMNYTVRRIRELLGQGIKARRLAELLGVRPQVISKIKHRQIYGRV